MKLLNGLFVGVFAVLVCFCDAFAETYPCPSGCFCMGSGNVKPTIQTTSNIEDVLQKKCAQTSAEANGISSGSVSLCGGRSIANSSAKEDFKNANYYTDDFSVYYLGYFGFYGFKKDGAFVYFPGGCNNSEGKRMYTDSPIYNCPEKYPNSDAGAKALTDCYKYSANGEKEHYKVPNVSGSGNTSVSYDIESMTTLVKNLQSALGQATKAAQDLESALNKAKQNNKTQNTNTTSTKTSVSNSTSSDIQSDLNNWAKANDNSKLIQLDPSVNGKAVRRNATDQTFEATFSYGMVSGTMTCNNTKRSSSNYPPDYFAAKEKTGRYCWCRVTNPINAYWVYDYSFNNPSSCSSYCLDHCIDGIMRDSSFRKLLFQNVASTTTSINTSVSSSTNGDIQSSLNNWAKANDKSGGQGDYVQLVVKNTDKGIMLEKQDLEQVFAKSAVTPIGRSSVVNAEHGRAENNNVVGSRSAKAVSERHGSAPARTTQNTNESERKSGASRLTR